MDGRAKTAVYAPFENCSGPINIRRGASKAVMVSIGVLGVVVGFVAGYWVAF
jgi:type IV secretory pathway TrbD component